MNDKHTPKMKVKDQKELDGILHGEIVATARRTEPMDVKVSNPQFSSSFGEGRWRVKGITYEISNGVVALLLGGEEPHIGAVAMALPRPSLKNKTKISATCSVFTLLGHKEDEVAKPAAIKLATELHEVAVVIAGIHVHKATRKEIGKLMDNSEKVVQILLGELRRHRR